MSQFEDYGGVVDADGDDGYSYPDFTGDGAAAGAAIDADADARVDADDRLAADFGALGMRDSTPRDAAASAASPASSDDDDDDDAPVAEWACAYCGIQDPACVAKCVATGKWFCN